MNVRIIGFNFFLIVGQSAGSRREILQEKQSKFSGLTQRGAVSKDEIRIPARLGNGGSVAKMGLVSCLYPVFGDPPKRSAAQPQPH